MVLTTLPGSGQESFTRKALSSETLDLADATLDDERTPDASAVDRSSIELSGPLDILFLDDDLPTRELMQFAMGRLGHRVLCSSSVQEAINLLRTFVFDVMICDLSLPDGSGLEVIHHVPPGHELCKIILSGHGETMDVARSLAAGFDAHLIKPIDLPMLERAVEKITGRKL